MPEVDALLLWPGTDSYFQNQAVIKHMLNLVYTISSLEHLVIVTT